MQSFTDKEKLDFYAQKIHDSGIDITTLQKEEWTMLAYACASQGEDGREPFQLICSNYPGYSREECDKHFSYCLRTSRNCVSLGTLVKIARDHGIELNLPRGRRKKSTEVQEKEKGNQFQQISDYLRQHYSFRYNLLREQVEMSEDGEAWRDFDDRELNSILTRMHATGIKASRENVETYITSKDFSQPFNPVLSYIQKQGTWNRRTDYIRRVFDHLELEEWADRGFLFEAFKLWFVCYVGQAAGLDTPNQLMLVIEGEKEGTGKTEFILQMVPPELRQYIHAPTTLTNFKDKDEQLATTSNILFFLDEIMLNKSTANKLKNMVGGAGGRMVNERAPYAHFAKMRRVYASLAATTNNIDFLPESLGDRRYLVLPVTASKNYDGMPIGKAFAQAYYLATHPRSYSTKIKPEMIRRMKEINTRYAIEDICTALIPAILRQPQPGEKAQAVTSAEIISWMTTHTGPNTSEYTPHKVNAAMKKLGFQPKKGNKGNIYCVKRIFADERKLEGELLANKIELSVNETDVKMPDPELPF